MSRSTRNLCPNCFNAGYSGGNCTSCGYTALHNAESFALPAGTTLNDRYLLGRVLGIGGFGITYLAIDLQTGGKCAVKEYFPRADAVRQPNMSVLPQGRNADSFAHGLAVFTREAKTLSCFIGNELIVQVMDSFAQNNTAYFTMEHLDGINAKALMRANGGRVKPGLAMELLWSVAKALQAVHSHDMLHRDISPENIFITRDGRIKLIDFGATRYFMGDASRSLSIILKPGFAPPEQYSSKGVQGPWTDIYALAATYYNLVSGAMVPAAPDRMAGQPHPSLAEIDPVIYPQISLAIEKALAIDYRQRYQSIEQFAAALTDGMELNPVPLAVGVTPYVAILGGRQAGAKWALPKDMEVLIGRSRQESNIMVDSPNVSRVHCRLRFAANEGVFYLCDQSSNGTYLANGRRLEKERLYSVMPECSFYLSEPSIMLKVGIE
jgi:serine/threonine protein kinase